MAIETQASAKAAGFNGSLRSFIFDRHVARLTAERHDQPILSFEDWQADQIV